MKLTAGIKFAIKPVFIHQVFLTIFGSVLNLFSGGDKLLMQMILVTNLKFKKKLNKLKIQNIKHLLKSRSDTLLSLLINHIKINLSHFSQRQERNIGNETE